MGSSRELYGIQYLRGAAALAVTVHHALEVSNGARAGDTAPDWLTTCGAAGVDVFFVVSGFIMLHVCFPEGRSPERPGPFFAKRAARVMPLYWLCTAVLAAACAAGFLRNLRFDGQTILNSVLLLPGDKLVGIAWTLSYEVYFYLAFGLALLLARRVATAATTVALILGAMGIGAALPDGTLARFLASPIALEFCFGIGLALAFARARRWPFKLIAALPALVLIGLAPVLVPHADTAGLPDGARVLAWGLPATLAVAAFLGAGPPRTALGRAASRLGDASYALYLTHVFGMIAYGLLIKATPVGDLPQSFIVPVVVLACVALGLATHALVERPLLAATRGLIAGGRAPERLRMPGLRV